MKTQKGDFPLDIRISFNTLFSRYRNLLDATNQTVKDRAKTIVAIAEKHPQLSEGIKSADDFAKYQQEIDIILEDIFSTVLETNEIKIATTPFNEFIFKSSQRFKNIMADAGEEFQLELSNFNDSLFYIFCCNIILNTYYGFTTDFKRPFFYNIPDKNGLMRNYKVLYNADFIEIEKKENAKEITREDVDELLESFDDLAVWKEKFPPDSWIFKGFIIANMFDATLDVSLSDFKANLLRREVYGGSLSKDFETTFKKIFNQADLQIGFSDYNEEDEVFEKMLYKDIDSFILNDLNKQDCKEALCNVSYYTLFKQKQFYCITNTEKYHKLYPDNILYKKLLEQNIKSCILAAIVDNDQILGILEIVSPHVNALNTVNANKLHDILPYLQDSVARSKERVENDLELIIQEECTSIHSSVHWKFRKEAKRYLSNISSGNPSFFREVVFEDVYPLYGQVDIKGSSEARNTATKKDLALQLEHIQTIIKKIIRLEPLPIYEQIDFSIEGYRSEIEDALQVDTERNILNFLFKEINPLFKHLRKKNENLKALIEEYDALIDSNTGFIYKYRKEYDESVMLINKRLASLLDKKQLEAQKMYPHYFERFKTDGVEHNMYIGESITKSKSFNKIYLYNLRLWQLQVMCEMENNFYKLKERLPLPLDVASMILAFNTPLALRFRMDEKRFDVDGTYNARYEVVKKRVDKANIKGTEERITQAGKISIIYSQKEDEIEYLKYIHFLQAQNKLHTDVEILELQDLQGVTGLKALRVSVMYSKEDPNETDAKEYYTYDELLSHINS